MMREIFIILWGNRLYLKGTPNSEQNKIMNGSILLRPMATENISDNAPEVNENPVRQESRDVHCGSPR